MTKPKNIQADQQLRIASVESLKVMSLALVRVKERASELPEHDAMAQLVLDAQKAVDALRLTTEAFFQMGKHLDHATTAAREKLDEGKAACECCGLPATIEGLCEGGNRYIPVCKSCQSRFSFLSDAPLGSHHLADQ